MLEKITCRARQVHLKSVPRLPVFQGISAGVAYLARAPGSCSSQVPGEQDKLTGQSWMLQHPRVEGGFMYAGARVHDPPGLENSRSFAHF